MIHLDDPNEQIIEIQHVGTFHTPNGKFKILTLIVKINRQAEIKY